MDADTAVRVLEEAAHAMGTPKRVEAEAVFLQFKTTPRPYDLCWAVLERTQNEFVQFSAISTVRDAIVREYEQLSEADVNSIRERLLMHLKDQRFQPMVRNQLRATIAVIFKRGYGTATSMSSAQQALRATIMGLLHSSSQEEQWLGFLLISAILDEFGSAKRSSRVGLTWEFHHASKRAFELNDMKELFRIVVSALNAGISLASPSPAETSILEAALDCADRILQWQFTHHRPYRMMGTFEGLQSALFRPGKTWADVFEASIIYIFMRLYERVRGHIDMSSKASQCLVQLASVSCNTFSTDHAVAYLTTFCEALPSISIASLNAAGMEPLTAAAGHLISNFGAELVGKVPRQTQTKFLDYLGELTVASLRMMVNAGDDDSDRSDVAFDNCMQAWINLFGYGVEVLPHWEPYASSVFEAYLQLRLARAARDAVSTEEVREEETDDYVLYEEQLSGLATLGRRNAQHCLGLVSHLFQERFEAYQSLLLGHNQADETLVRLHEEFHWLAMIAGHLLADHVSGEEPMMPQPLQEVSAAADAAGAANPVLQLSDNLIKLLTLLEECLAGSTSTLVSPQVLASVMWALGRWATSYLFINVSIYSSLSPSLLNALDPRSQTAHNTLMLLTKAIANNLVRFCGDDTVLPHVVGLLHRLARIKAVPEALRQSDAVWQLANMFCDPSSPMGQISPNMQQQVAEALCRVCSAEPNDDARAETLSRLVGVPLSRLQEIASMQDFAARRHEELIIRPIVALVHVVRGFIRASDRPNASSLISLLGPRMECIVFLFRSYADRPEVATDILRLFADLADYFLPRLIALGPAKTQALSLVLKYSLSVINVWAEVHRSKITSAEGEDDRIEALIVLINILTGIATGDEWLIDPSEQTAAPEVEAADVVLQGVYTIVPAMTGDLLQRPELSEAYFQLLDLLGDTCRDKIYRAPAAFLEQVVHSVDYGLQGPSKIARMALGLLQNLALEHLNQGDQGLPTFRPILRHYLDSLFQHYILEPFDLDLLELASESLFVLICSDQEYFVTLARQLIQQQPNQDQATRLDQAFQALTTANSIRIEFKRQNRKKFVKNFGDFLMTVRGFLMKA